MTPSPWPIRAQSLVLLSAPAERWTGLCGQKPRVFWRPILRPQSCFPICILPQRSQLYLESNGKTAERLDFQKALFFQLKHRLSASRTKTSFLSMFLLGQVREIHWVKQAAKPKPFLVAQPPKPPWMRYVPASASTPSTKRGWTSLWKKQYCLILCDIMWIMMFCSFNISIANAALLEHRSFALEIASLCQIVWVFYYDCFIVHRVSIANPTDLRSPPIDRTTTHYEPAHNHHKNNIHQTQSNKQREWMHENAKFMWKKKKKQTDQSSQNLQSNTTKQTNTHTHILSTFCSTKILASRSKPK